MPYRHKDCGGCVEAIPMDGPPDPDRWGNRRYPYRCQKCDERFTVTWADRERCHILPEALIHVDDRGVPPEEITAP